ncbi:MAG: hypothetical protein AUJ96_11945 [Armatimonadetes bacterium CG2_30_66_41]|nr:MAG: hypothetical protein AUJ96_11945 [Armatimonadetes bacterium CG2_30_66_41]
MTFSARVLHHRGKRTLSVGARTRLPGMWSQHMNSEQGTHTSRSYPDTPPFGATGFDLDGLRQGMATRREATLDAVRCVPTEVDGLPCGWVIAEGADPDLRPLYLHGGGSVSGSGAFFLALAAHLSAAARSIFLPPDYRLAPEHPFPAAVRTKESSYEPQVPRTRGQQRERLC